MQDQLRADALDTSAPAKIRTGEDVLAAYWGDRWPDIRESILAAGYGADLSRPTQVLPWEKVAPEFFKLVTQVDPEKIARRYRLGSLVNMEVEDVENFVASISPPRTIDRHRAEELALLAADLDAAMQGAIERLVDSELVYRFRAWEAGEYDRSPVCWESASMARPLPPGSEVRNSISASGMDWHVSLPMRSGFDANFDQAYNEWESLRRDKQRMLVELSGL
ncbi:MAG: hypothetical protein WD226_00325 [Planctomycetota bacterium]